MGVVLEIYILSGISYLIYALCMGKDVAYRLKRWYLLAVITAAGIIPFIEFNVGLSTAQEIHRALHYMPADNKAGTFLWVYCLGAFLMFLRFVKQLFDIRRKLNEDVVQRYRYKGAEVVVCAREKGDEFSFFNKIAISKNLTEREKELVLSHEISHVRHFHSLEKLLIELLKIGMWFNPFVYIAAIHIEELQEYQADFDVLHSGADKKEYVALIVEQVITSALPVSSKFYSYFTKNRFNKMLTPPSERRVMAIIAFAVVWCIMFLFTIKAEGYMSSVRMGIPQIMTGEPDSLEQAGQMHTYTPDNEKFKNKIESVPDPDEQVLIIPK